VRSTPVLPSAFLNDHASDEDSSRVLPFRAAQNQTIFSAWIAWENYFFEWCYWIGLAVYGVAFAPWGLIAIVPQAIIFGSIWGVTGIPPTEKQAIRSKGDAYRDYQKRVSRFIPLPPKSHGNDA
jgi:steroid 5-alpha reductase family enzyme